MATPDFSEPCVRLPASPVWQAMRIAIPFAARCRRPSLFLAAGPSAAGTFFLGYRKTRIRMVRSGSRPKPGARSCRTFLIATVWWTLRMIAASADPHPS